MMNPDPQERMVALNLTMKLASPETLIGATQNVPSFPEFSFEVILFSGVLVLFIGLTCIGSVSSGTAAGLADGN